MPHVKMLANYAGPEGSASLGQTVYLNPLRAKEFVAGGFAEYVRAQDAEPDADEAPEAPADEPTAPAIETATAPPAAETAAAPAKPKPPRAPAKPKPPKEPKAG